MLPPAACVATALPAATIASLVSVRANGTYHAETAIKEAARRTRLLIGIGGLVAVIGFAGVLLTNADMTRIETSGPERLGIAGAGLERFIPSVLTNMARANQPLSTSAGFVAGDPRHSAPYIEDKRALERWLALTGFGLATLFIGLETRIPSSTAQPRSPTGSDLSRLLILISLAYAALSLFESG
jgi:hypothetical protein